MGVMDEFDDFELCQQEITRLEVENDRLRRERDSANDDPTMFQSPPERLLHEAERDFLAAYEALGPERVRDILDAIEAA